MKSLWAATLSNRGLEWTASSFTQSSAIVAVVLVLASVPLEVRAQAVSVDPAKMPRIGTVDERFASYNIEMAEVTGGNFWKPYRSQGSTEAQATQSPQSASTPAGMDPNMYQYRPPIDLTNFRLRKLAAALGPTYVRVSTLGPTRFILRIRPIHWRRLLRDTAVC